MDFKEQLKKQLRFIESSCKQYDAGDKDEAIRIAQALRVVFHNTGPGKSTSILAHLKVKGIKLLSTCEDLPPGKVFWPNLTNIRLSRIPTEAPETTPNPEYIPKLEAARTKRFVAQSQWWLNEIVYLVEGTVITRKDLVLDAANTDGGAHVAARFKKRYDDLLAGAGWSMVMSLPTGEKELPFLYGHLAALRQIGHETLNSPDLLKLI